MWATFKYSNSNITNRQEKDETNVTNEKIQHL
jgi:hypothetical protein